MREKLRAEGVSPRQLICPCEVVKNFYFFCPVISVGKYIHISLNHVMDGRTAIFFCVLFPSALLLGRLGSDS